MKHCPYCKIEVGGTSTKCPFCQSGLSGEDDIDFWPKPNLLHTQSILYKLQLFIVLALAIVGFGLDFLFELNTGLHWSLLLAMWLLAVEFGIFRLFKRNYSPARIVTLFVLTVAVLVTVTSYFLGNVFWSVTTQFVIPALIIGTMICNLIFILTDEISNAMVYLLCNIVIGIVPYLVMRVIHEKISILWVICLIVSMITFLAACVFRGRGVLGELQKRFHV